MSVPLARGLARRRVRRATTPTCRCGASWPPPPGGPVLDVGAGTGRVALDLARAGRRRRGARPRAGAAGGARERARGDGLAVRTVAADAAGFALDAAFRLIIVPMQTIQLLPERAGVPRRGRRAPRARAGCSRSPSPRRSRTSTRPTASCPRPTSATVGGYRFASQPTAVRALPPRPRGSSGVRRTFAPDGADRGGGRRDRARPRDASRSCEAEGRAAGLAPEPARTIDADDGPRRLRGGAAACLSARPARLRALSRPDEHLRRPRQPDRVRAPLHVARDRASSSRAPGSATRSTPTPTTSSTSAAARTATRRSARATSRRSSATRCTRPPTAARSCSRSAAACSCSATATSWRTSGCRASGSSTSTPGARTGRGCSGTSPSRSTSPAGPRCSRASRTTRAGRTSARGPRRSGRVLRGQRQQRARRDARACAAGRHGTVIGTYMHGPLLPKNTAFADWLVAHGARGSATLPPLDDALEDAAHAEAARAAGLQLADAAEPHRGDRDALRAGDELGDRDVLVRARGRSWMSPGPKLTAGMPGLRRRASRRRSSSPGRRAAPGGRGRAARRAASATTGSSCADLRRAGRRRAAT